MLLVWWKHLHSTIVRIVFDSLWHLSGYLTHSKASSPVSLTVHFILAHLDKSVTKQETHCSWVCLLASVDYAVLLLQVNWMSLLERSMCRWLHMLTMQLYICPAGGHGLSFTLKLWVCREIPAMYVWTVEVLFMYNTYLKKLDHCAFYGDMSHAATRLITWTYLEVSCHACCKCIQLESSSPSQSLLSQDAICSLAVACLTELKYTLTQKYLNVLIWTLW